MCNFHTVNHFWIAYIYSTVNAVKTFALLDGTGNSDKENRLRVSSSDAIFPNCSDSWLGESTDRALRKEG